MQDTHRIQETYPQEGIDSKAYLLCFLRRIPYMLLIGLTGAIIGSGLYLLIAAINNRRLCICRRLNIILILLPDV